jgi:CHAT domain
MRDTIVSIMGSGDAGMVVYLDSPSAHEDALEYRPLSLDASKMPVLDTSANVTAYGAAVRAALSGHPAIEHELTEIFGLPAPERLALRFLIRTPDAERLRWETIHSGPPDTRFLAISDLCTVSRLAPTKIESALRAFTYPLRMIAFLSAAGIKAAAEMQKICERIVAIKAEGLRLECTIFVGEQAVLDDYQQRIATGDMQHADVTVKQIPATATEIANLLRDSPVQFVHFFCHGVERLGVQGLSLATINDHDVNELTGNADASSIFLSVTALSEAVKLNSSIWVTVLNSCSGGMPIRQLFSMALDVAKKGCPYTVGMAEPIDTDAATRFSEAFYGELFRIVKSRVPAGVTGAVEMDLAPAVIPARKIIHDHCNVTPNNFGRWLLPLLYEAAEQPLVVLSLPPELAGRILDVAKSLRQMNPDTPLVVRGQILALLDKPPAVPAEFRPNRYGEFKYD